MRVLIADKFPDGHIDTLRGGGFIIEYRPELTAPELPDAIGGVEVLVVRSTRVEADTLGAGDVLELVVRAGAGFNTIDVDAAAACGIYVANVPGRNAVAVAELTLALLLAIDRNIPDNVIDLRAGRWDKARYQQAQGIFGRRLGIVGLGAIGMAVAIRAAAFGMRLHALAKPQRDEATIERLARLGFTYHRSLEELAAAVDVLTFHVPAVPETAGIVGKELLSHMRPGGILINTSRGDLVDEAALLEALDAKGLRAGLDVYADEPGGSRGTFESRLARHPNVYGTHHIGASTNQAQEAIATEVVRILQAFSAGGVSNVVNLDTSVRGSSTFVVRHFNRVGVLARVLRALSEAGINVEQMDNRIFAGGEAAAATIQASGGFTDELTDRLRDLPDVIGVSVERRDPRP